ncbi:hypothetical protein Ga0100231_002540 [Opitutaceae bacterium TAV4]|nr:hypothetical protein Ga0100231_002540 [Opitutaceae bacterium TAV4]
MLIRFFVCFFCYALATAFSAATVATNGNKQSILATLAPDQTHAIGWGTSPTFRFAVKNSGVRELTNLTVTFSITDVATGKPPPTIATTRVLLGNIAPNIRVERSFTPALSAGVFDIRWELTDADAVVLVNGKLRTAQMFADVSALAAGEKERAWVRHWSLLGGIFWKATNDLERVAKTGGVWERFGNTSMWRTLELEPGRIDVSPAVSEVKRLSDAGMDLVYFNTVYNQPRFYQVNQERFAAAYGRLHVEQARAFGDKVGVYELGNEDNGPTKFLYTEIARHGAAGVRSQNADALIANSGTAQIDIGWLRMQAARGLFDRMDALITHPYSWSSPPEIYGTLTQLEQVDQIIDELGGMKVQLTTEWGYPHTFDQLKRAQWAPRHMAIAAAVGMYRHGLYSFDNHFGIYDNGRPFPMAATLNAHTALTHAHRFAGWLEKSDTVWAAVYEKAGRPLLMAWSPLGQGVVRIQIGRTAGGIEIRDMYGNLLTTPQTREGSLEIELAAAPVYVSGLGAEVTLSGYREAMDRARQRYSRLLEISPLKGSREWQALANATPGDSSTVDALLKTLSNWNPNEIAPKEQAVVAQAMRWFSLAVHAQAAALPKSGGGGEAARQGDRYEFWTRRLRESVAADLDQPSLRWVLLHWRQLRDEQAMLEEWGELGKARHLAMLGKVYDRICGVLDAKGTKLFFPLWAYAHSPSTTVASGARYETPNWGESEGVSAGETRLAEQFQFIPGRPVPVKIRLHSYSGKTYESTVRLDLPSGWTSNPAEWHGEVSPDSPREVIFQVIAGDGTARRFATVLSVPGKPPVRIPFDDFEILPPVEVSVPVLSQTVPDAPLPLRVANHGTESISAKLRILEGSGLPSLARVDIRNLNPGKTRNIEVKLPVTRRAPPFHAWSLIAEINTSAGRTFQLPLTLDYELSGRASASPPLDGELTGWEAALPLHLDKQEYTRGSFGATWSKEDLSGVVYTMWDESNFYIAARVTDQLFNQELDGSATWNQDSVQFILTSENGPMNPFALALTPKGPQVWNQRAGRLAKAQLKVKLNQGETVYEAAIPWAEFEGILPREGLRLRFDVLFNDDDAIINRRFMGRYGIGIAHHRKIDLLGWLQLEGTATNPVAIDSNGGTSADTRPQPEFVFFEDFEEYQPDRAPNRWQSISHLEPVPRTWVREGVGRKGSKGLELTNTVGRKSHVFCNLIRPLESLEAGRRYQLSAWVKGKSGAGFARLLGVCSDRFGNEGFSYVAAWSPSDEWQEVKLNFKTLGGRLNVIVRNDRQLDGLLIDDIKITALP